MPPIIVVTELACILQTCTQHKRDLLYLHEHMRQIGLCAHPWLADEVVLMWVKGENMSRAQEVFDQLPIPSAISWNALITGYVKHGESSHALMMYMTKQEYDTCRIDEYSFLALLKACIELKDLNVGCDIHQQLVQNGLLEMDVFLGSAVVDMYAKCGSMAKARDTFDKLQLRDAITWTTLLAGYVENQQGEEALSCFMQMQKEGVSPDAFTYSCSLKACGIVGVREKGQQLHMGLTKIGLDQDLVVSSTVINIYAKQGFVEEAFKVFDSLQNCNIVSWNALLTGLTECGHSNQTLVCFQQLLDEVLPDVVTCICALKACGSIGDLTNSEEVHMLIVKIGVEGEIIVGNSLIDMYVKCGSLARAEEVFDGLVLRSIVSWNALIGGYVDDGQGDEALKWLKQMECEGMSLDHVTFCYGLRAHGSSGAIHGVQEIHAAIVERGMETNLVIINTLVDQYTKCGLLTESRQVFDQVPVRDRVSWNVLISGYVEHAHSSEVALKHLEDMQCDIASLDAVMLSCCLRACGNAGAVTKGRRLHMEILKKGLEGDPFLANSLLDMYVRCGFMVETQALFDTLQVQTSVPWNTLIKGYVEFEHHEESIHCFEQMQHEGVSPDPIICAYCLKACSNLLAVEKGRDLHGKIIKRGLDKDVLVGSSVVDMYCRWGLTDEALTAFSQLSVRTIFSWTALLAGYADSGYSRETLNCLKQMKEEDICPDDVVYACALKASAILGALDKGMELHAEIIRRGLEGEHNIGSTLIFLYIKCNLLMEAQKVFDGLEDRNAVSWTTLIAGEVEHGYAQEALDHLEQMHHCNTLADKITLVCGLKACSIIGNTDKGFYICSKIIERGLESDLSISNALVYMYAKFGLLSEAQRAFDKLVVCEESSWTILITGYAQLGESQSVFFAFHQMLKEGVSPNAVTFLSMLNVCTHGGLVDHGEACFEFMDKLCRIVPTLEHYNCMIDLFARAGDLDKALTIVNTMPFHPSPVVWQTVLGACRKWKNVDLVGAHIFEHILQMDERDSAAYICVYNIHADAELVYQEIEV